MADLDRAVFNDSLCGDPATPAQRALLASLGYDEGWAGPSLLRLTQHEAAGWIRVLQLPGQVVPEGYGCPHRRRYTRVDGVVVCLACLAVQEPGERVWTPTPVRYCPAPGHVPLPNADPGAARQCQHCPAVWDAPEGGIA